MPRFLEMAKKFPNLNITPFIYKVPEQCPSLVKNAGDFEILFFSGIIPYYLAREEAKEKNLPVVYIKFDDLNFALTLLKLLHKFDKKITDLNLSIDIPGADNIYRVLNELQIEKNNVFIKDYYYILQESKEEFNTETFVDYHYSAWREGNIDIAITSISSVERKLKELGVNCLGIPIPEKSILNTLVEASSIGKLLYNQGMQITIGFAYLHSLQKFQVINQQLKNFSDETDASIQYLGNNLYVIYLTRNSLEYITNHYKELYIISEINKQIGVDISFGFGLGLTTKEAERNAKTALEYAKQSGGNCCFVVSNENRVIGPINKGARTYVFKTDNKKHLELSQKTGIGIVNLSKIFEFNKLRKSEPFSATDLAEYLKVSQRSSERIIKKLVDNYYCQVVGTEYTYQKGRPKALYVINFNKI